MRTLFSGGTLVTPAGSIIADLLVEDERIAATGVNLPGDGAAVVDARGMYVLPGGIDVHTHLDMPLDDIASSDDFATGHVAAAFGGTTSHLDFVIQPKGATLRRAFDLWLEKAERKACIDYGFHMTIANPTPSVLQEIRRLPEWGITSVKVLMAYKGRLQVDDATLLQVLREARDAGVLTLVHAENGDVIDLLVREAVAAGHLAPKYHVLTRPPELEGEATGRAITLAALARAPVYIVHLTCEAALRLVREAKVRGQRVWAETCVQYLFCTAADLDRPGAEAVKYVCSPPFRTPTDQRVLWDALRDGTLSAVSTDHCPFFLAQKLRGRDDFTKIPNGVPAIEDRVVLLHHAGVNGGRLSLSRFVEVTATTPAKLFGLYPRKGSLDVGADADLVLFDPRKTKTISARTHHMRVDYSVFEGMAVQGVPAGVWVRGRQVVDGERFLGVPGSGRFLHRAPFAAA